MYLTVVVVRLENNVVTEGESVQICLVLFNEELITTGAASVILITNDTQTNSDSIGETFEN